MPWTLGRMQQLPYLARCWADPAIREKLDSSTSGSDLLPKEFQNEILDFIAANPPRWGVQWASPMDAAIRAINWLAAYDIFSASGYNFPDHSFASSNPAFGIMPGSSGGTRNGTLSCATTTTWRTSPG